MAAACAPDPVTPPSPTWVTTHVARTTTPTSVTNYVGAWTSTDWASTLEITTPNAGGGTATLHFFPRSGPGNSVLGAPQSLTPAVSPSIMGPIGDRLVGLAGSQNGLGAVEFFRLTAGTWSSAGVSVFPADQQVAALNDDWLVTRSVPVNPGADAHVYVHAVDTSGPTVTLGAPVTLDPDPAWPLVLREGFAGPGAAIDGDLLIVGAQGQFGPTPGGARVFRATAGVWSPVVSLGASPPGPNAFGRALAVDDGATVDRVALGPQSDTTPVVEVYADTGSGFVLEQTITRNIADPDIYSGALFGNAIGLDGDLLAITSRGIEVPSSDPLHADVKVGYVELYRKGATWAREAEVATFTNPAPPAMITTLPFKLKVAGNHVGAMMFMSPDPPPNCVFPCFNFGFEAWSIDRTG